MTANDTHGRIRSAVGEHLIAVLIIAVAILAMLTAYPAIAAETKGTADRAQERADMPLVVAAQLDDQSAAPSTP